MNVYSTPCTGLPLNSTLGVQLDFAANIQG